MAEHHGPSRPGSRHSSIIYRGVLIEIDEIGLRATRAGVSYLIRWLPDVPGVVLDADEGPRGGAREGS